jgi:hypothetical protein
MPRTLDGQAPLDQACSRSGDDPSQWEPYNVRADRYTVVVTLKHPDASFETVLATTGGVFERSFEEAHKTTMGTRAYSFKGQGHGCRQASIRRVGSS